MMFRHGRHTFRASSTGLRCGCGEAFHERRQSDSQSHSLFSVARNTSDNTFSAIYRFFWYLKSIKQHETFEWSPTYRKDIVKVAESCESKKVIDPKEIASLDESKFIFSRTKKQEAKRRQFIHHRSGSHHIIRAHKRHSLKGRGLSHPHNCMITSLIKLIRKIIDSTRGDTARLTFQLRRKNRFLCCRVARKKQS